MSSLISLKLAMWGSIVAIGGSLTSAFTQLFADALPPMSDLTSTVGTGSLLVGSAGLLTALGALLDKYWKDRADARMSEERKLKIQTQVTRNSWMTKDLHNWIVEAHKANPQLPEPPKWVSLHVDHGEGPHP